MKRGIVIVIVLALVLTTAVVYGASQGETADTVQSGAVVALTPVRFMESPDSVQDEESAETEEHADTDVLTWDEAVAAVRSHMIMRDTSFTLYVEPVEDGQEKILKAAIGHTGVPDEGDYIWRNLGCQNISRSDGGTDDYDIYTFSFAYRTTKEQEDALAGRIDEILSQLGVYEMEDDLDKITAVYQWITNHVTYDHDHLGDSTYQLQYTAYAAMLDGTAVCNGCSALLYRMLLTAGIDSRSIANDDHSWNIIALDGVYYNADVTWDLGKDPEHYGYFLKGSSDFYEEHIPSAEYETESFRSIYHIAEQDYVFPVSDADPVADQADDESEPDIPVQYVTLLSEIPESAIERMKSQAVSAYYTDFVPGLSESFEVQGFDYIGSYFLSAREGAETDVQNRIFLMFKATCTAFGKNEDGDVSSYPFIYFTYYEFENGFIDSDGAFSIDGSDYSVCEDTVINIVFDYTVPEKEDQRDSLTCYGYMQLGTAFDKIVTANAGKYDFESTVQEEPAAAQAVDPEGTNISAEEQAPD